MNRKEIVTVARKWKNPEILAFVTKTEVGSEMSLDSFLNALVEEIGNPTMLFTKASLSAKLFEAAEKIKTEMKEGTRFL